MFSRFFQLHADSAGFFASLLCAIHCSAIPILISLGLMGSGSWLHNHLFDWIIIGFGFIMAGYAIVGDYVKKHRNIKPLILAVTGFIFLLVGMIDHHGWMLIFSVTGGIMVASSHVLNWKYTQTCSRMKSITL
ncbi:MAG: MerC domain-containing protein [Saprospiraceae bacterium]|nr:MerC domain-containing protein [Saprospiraceae bacterium]MBK6564852.1 MerC domain-containing protein [Saprospiraceae bacterium]MBK6782995.1 MerC domain-containing protein [Saprospiraceae bacterium]MBK7523495.1 MerC domain-containing protein [Saprospiraceae bacterium]MBK8371516.1 MerC domain-containing protein [Saprospiraceae bacterium]